MNILDKEKEFIMRKRWKRAIAVMMFAAVMVSGCGSNTAKKSSAEEPVHITFGHGQAEGHPYHIAALQFKKEVEKKTDHRVIVDVQPNGNLGDEREMTEGLQLGTIDITVAVAATLSGFDSDLDVFNFPYLFDSREEAFKVLDGKTGQKIFKGDFLRYLRVLQGKRTEKQELHEQQSLHACHGSHYPIRQPNSRSHRICGSSLCITAYQDTRRFIRRAALCRSHAGECHQ